MLGPILALALGGAPFLSAGDQGSLTQLRCVSGQPHASVSLDDIQRTFAQRAAEILAAAMAHDRQVLARTISPRATFMLWRGDAGAGREVGVEGALEFAAQLTATRFTSFLSFPAPLAGDPCGVQETDLLLSNDRGAPAYAIRFRFDGGILVSVEGQEGEVMRGDLAGARHPNG